MPPEATGHDRSVLIVAGEASGDLHGAGLVTAMGERDPSLRFYGIGGEKMQAAGVELVAHAADMGVVGPTDGISRLFSILRVLRLLKRSLRERKPALVILIDYPDFNLLLAKAAHKAGRKIFYYISPQVWAWRKRRVQVIKRLVDTMAVILPFEVPLYREAGVNVHFVGHPLLDVVTRRYGDAEALRHFGLQDGFTTVALLPGSRRSEVARHLPEMLGAAEIMAREIPRLQFVLPLAPTLDEAAVLPAVARCPFPVRVVRNAGYDAVGISDVALVASGTASLETALLETPMVVIYRVSLLSYLVARVLVKIDHISLVNIIAGKAVVPELIQERANAEEMAAAALAILRNEARRAEITRELGKIRESLGEHGAARRAADLALKVMERTGRRIPER